MDVKMRVGRWYKLSNGRIDGPATKWTDDHTIAHPFELPVVSQCGEKKTLFRENGTTDYAAFHVVEEVAPPSFVEAGGFYRTKSGIVVGPMVLAPGYDDVFKSERDELKAINGAGFSLTRGQQWTHNGSVQFANKYEEGHKLVARVSESDAVREGWYPATATESNAPQTKPVSEKTLRIDLSASDFSEAFKVVADEFSKQIAEAVKASEEREAEIERLKKSLELVMTQRNEWFEAWRVTGERKQRGDARLRAARQRLKAQKAANVGLSNATGVLLERLKVAESGEQSKKVKAVVDAIGGIILLVGVAAATWALVA